MRTSFSTIAFAAANELGASAAHTVATSNVAAPATAKPKRVAKPAKPVAPVDTATATESKPDPRVERAARIAADRSATNALYATFESNRVSVPVKALSAFKPLATTAHPINRNPSVRQAAAIAAAFSASGLKLIDGKAAPRVFELNGVRSCIENGALRDAVSSGLITVSGDTPETEMLKLTPKASAAIAGLIGAAAIKAGKLAA